MKKSDKLIIGMSGASGAIYAIKLLTALKTSTVETHLVISKAAALTIVEETNWKISDITSLADFYYNINNIGACIASGSFQTMGMVILPCSVKTMSQIATGVTANLLSRAADVTLKERRRLVLAVRESPLHIGHLRTMVSLAEMGAIIVPPMPALYPRPDNIDQMVDHNVGRILDLFAITNNLVKRWNGI